MTLEPPFVRVSKSPFILICKSILTPPDKNANMVILTSPKFFASSKFKAKKNPATLADLVALLRG